VVDISYTGLLVVGLVAVGAPLLANVARKLHLPSPALEIVLGIVVGPQLLGWVKADDVAVEVVSALGVAFLLFLAGLELDLPAISRRFHPVLVSFAVTLVLAFPVAWVLHRFDVADETSFLAIALVATSLGLVVPILQDSGQLTTSFGQTVMGNASLGEFGSILLLSLFFSQDGTTPGAETFLLVLFVASVAVAALGLARAGRSAALSRTVLRLENTSAQLGIRVAIALLLIFVALSGRLGLETVLGAFVAGALLRVVDPEARITHEQFMSKVQAIGYGFLVPAFFVATGVSFDIDALIDSPGSMGLVPLFMAALLVVRAAPAAVYTIPAFGREGQPLMGLRQGAAAGLLQATSLSFLIVAATVGVETERIDSATSAAVVGGGLGSVILFPPIALALLGRARGAGMPARWHLPQAVRRAEHRAPAAARHQAPLGADPHDLRVLTANVRYANPKDSVNSWTVRRGPLSEAVRALDADVIGFQETLAEQVADLVDALPDHDWFGEGRNDGAVGGEFTPIFYRRRRFEPVDGGTLWLSESPTVPGSSSWGASHPRVATWLRLQCRWTGTELVVANTHLDHARSEIRVHQVETLLEHLLPAAGNDPLVVIGDFNDPPGSEVHTTLVEVLRDARDVSQTPPEGPSTTFNGFSEPKEGALIDHVFIRGPLDVRAVRVVDEQRDDGRYLSDHFPVLASLHLET
jgi:Kef-type K+ transport system membrane component KefB/endonuclease/exonuclease/phosphatase family metal-dependent hydrolase